MPKIIRIVKIMFHEDISYHKYIKTWFILIIYTAKHLIWTTLKAIFLIFRFFLNQILSYRKYS